MIYLDNAATTLRKPEAVIEAGGRCHEKYGKLRPRIRKPIPSGIQGDL